MRIAPEYTGVDPKIVPYANAWLSLAKDRGLKFDHTVTIGFKDINYGNTVGLCHYGLTFREIDIDKKDWNGSSEFGKMALLYHELGHCYCNRNHDYGDRKKYGSNESSRDDPNKKDGFFPDKCPVSLMFPIVIESDCFKIHYWEYIDEVFKNCEPW